MGIRVPRRHTLVALPAAACHTLLRRRRQPLPVQRARPRRVVGVPRQLHLAALQRRGGKLRRLIVIWDAGRHVARRVGEHRAVRHKAQVKHIGAGLKLHAVARVVHRHRRRHAVRRDHRVVVLHLVQLVRAQLGGVKLAGTAAVIRVGGSRGGTRLPALGPPCGAVATLAAAALAATITPHPTARCSSSWRRRAGAKQAARAKPRLLCQLLHAVVGGVHRDVQEGAAGRHKGRQRHKQVHGTQVVPVAVHQRQARRLIALTGCLLGIQVGCLRVHHHATILLITGFGLTRRRRLLLLLLVAAAVHRPLAACHAIQPRQSVVQRFPPATAAAAAACRRLALCCLLLGRSGGGLVVAAVIRGSRSDCRRVVIQLIQPLGEGGVLLGTGAWCVACGRAALALPLRTAAGTGTGTGAARGVIKSGVRQHRRKPRVHLRLVVVLGLARKARVGVQRAEPRVGGGHCELMGCGGGGGVDDEQTVGV